MADKGGNMAISEHPKAPNPFFSLFQNLVKNLPLPKFEAKQRVADRGQEGQGEGEGEVISKKVDVVRFSEKRPIIPPPLKLEAEESDNSSSPTVLWQVCSMLCAHWNPRLVLKFYALFCRVDCWMFYLFGCSENRGKDLTILFSFCFLIFRILGDFETSISLGGIWIRNLTFFGNTRWTLEPCD